MAVDPLKISRQRQGPSLAFHTIGVQGYFGSVQPPFEKFLDPPLCRVPSVVGAWREALEFARSTTVKY